MKPNISTLPTGLKLLTVPLPSLESAIITVWVKTGSRNEDLKVNGISHFLEHMVFKGSSKRPTAKAISETVDSFGGEFNAATSKDYTMYYIKTGLDTFELAIDVLSDMVLNPVLLPEEIEREKGTIIQEIAMYEDSPQRNIHDVFENLIFEDHSLERDIAGTPKSVKGIMRNDFESYRKMHYFGKNMLVSVVGGINEKKTKELVSKYFAKVSNEAKEIKDETFDLKVSNPRIKLKNKKTEQANFIMGYLGEGRKYKNRYAQGVLSAILGANMSSRLFIEVRERRGLAYFVRSRFERYQDTGYLGVYAGVDPKNSEEAIKVILDQFEGLKTKKYPITKKELEKAKGYLKGNFVLALEDSGVVSDYFSEPELFDNERITIKDALKRLEKVTLDEIYDEAKRLFIPEKVNLAVIGPYKDDSKFSKILK